MLVQLRKRTFQIVQVAKKGDTLSAAFDWFIIVLILLNIVVFVLETEEAIRSRAPLFFRGFEAVSVLIFSVEYVLRVWSIVESERFSRPITGRLRFMATPMALVDLLAIAPFYLPMVGVDLRVLRVLRLFRLLRILKLARYTQALQLIRNTLVSQKEELITTLSCGAALMLIASTLMYYAERGAQPESFGSIPQAMWWAVVTLTTVGYGDIYPVTPIGRTLGAIISVLGIGVVALPTALLGAGFVEQIKAQRSQAQRTDD